jgi:hypothetical protein
MRVAGLRRQGLVQGCFERLGGLFSHVAALLLAKMEHAYLRCCGQKKGGNPSSGPLFFGERRPTFELILTHFTVFTPDFCGFRCAGVMLSRMGAAHKVESTGLAHNLQVDSAV